MISMAKSRERLHVMPTSAGYEIAADASYSWDGLQRGQSSFVVVQHTLAGAGRLRYERQRRTVAPGETMLVMIPHDHRYWIEDGERWEFFWIAMAGREALRLHRAILETAGPVFRLRADTVAGLARMSLDLRDAKARAAGEASAIAYAATMAIYDDLLGGDGRPRTMRSRSVEQALSYIRQNLDAPLDVEELAAAAGLSRSHFSRMFRSCEGISPAEYVFSERMRRATSLLASGDLPVKQISRECGFADPNYFTKAFRRSYGASPTEFRATGMYSSVGS